MWQRIIQIPIVRMCEHTVHFSKQSSLKIFGLRNPANLIVTLNLGMKRFFKRFWTFLAPYFYTCPVKTKAYYEARTIEPAVGDLVRFLRWQSLDGEIHRLLVQIRLLNLEAFAADR